MCKKQFLYFYNNVTIKEKLEKKNGLIEFLRQLVDLTHFCTEFLMQKNLGNNAYLLFCSLNTLMQSLRKRAFKQSLIKVFGKSLNMKDLIT